MINLFGSSKENLYLTIDKAKYQAGETVKGKLVVSIDNKKDINARSFRIISEGEEKTKVTVNEPSTSYDDKGNSTSSSHSVTYHDSDIFFSTNLEHFLSKSSNPSLISNTDNGITIHKGSTEMPFEFLLPNNILSSYNGRNASITYEIKATIDKKLRSDINSSISFDVVTIKEEEKNNNNNSTIYASDKNRKTGLYIILDLANNTYKIGDTIEGAIFIGKPNSNSNSNLNSTKTETTTIRGIKIKLIATEYATAHGRNVTTMIQSIDNEILNWKENEKTPFKIKIPETIITKSYRSKLSKLYWEVKANVDIPMDKDLNAISRIEII